MLLRSLLLSLIVSVIITPCVLAADNEAGKSNASTDELVLTPGGYRPESKVHEVKPGESIRMTNEGHLQKISPSGEVLVDYGVIKPGISNISTGSKVEKPLTEDWITYASWIRPAGTLIDILETLKRML
jgi:hypothetical protein